MKKSLEDKKIFHVDELVEYSENNYQIYLHIHATAVKISTAFFTEIGKILKFIYICKRTSIAKAILSKKNNAGKITILDLKIGYRAILIKNSLVLAQKHIQKSMEQNKTLKHEYMYLQPSGI